MNQQSYSLSENKFTFYLAFTNVVERYEIKIFVEKPRKLAYYNSKHYNLVLP